MNPTKVDKFQKYVRISGYRDVFHPGKVEAPLGGLAGDTGCVGTLDISWPFGLAGGTSVNGAFGV